MVQSSRFIRSEIKQFLAVAKRVMRTPALDILIAPTSRGQGRLLVITPRRIGTAPQRNTVRRRLKAIFHREQLAKYGYDWGVIIKEQGADLSSVDLTLYLHKVLGKISNVAQNNSLS